MLAGVLQSARVFGAYDLGRSDDLMNGGAQSIGIARTDNILKRGRGQVPMYTPVCNLAT